MKKLSWILVAGLIIMLAGFGLVKAEEKTESAPSEEVKQEPVLRLPLKRFFGFIRSRQGKISISFPLIIMEMPGSGGKSGS